MQTEKLLFNPEATAGMTHEAQVFYLQSRVSLYFRTPIVDAADLITTRETLFSAILNMPFLPLLELRNTCGSRGIADGIHYCMLRRYTSRYGNPGTWRVPVSADKFLHFFVHGHRTKAFLEELIGPVKHCPFHGAIDPEWQARLDVLNQLCDTVFGCGAFTLFAEADPICYEPD